MQKKIQKAHKKPQKFENYQKLSKNLKFGENFEKEEKF